MRKITIWAGSEETVTRKSHSTYYTFAFLFGAAIVVAAIIILKGLQFVFYIVSLYWMWVAGFVLGILVIRKVVMKKRVELVREEPY